MGEMQFPPGTPDEVKQFWQDRADRAEMAAAEAAIIQRRFFNETLDFDGARLLLQMFSMCARQESTTASYYEGYLTRLIEDRFNACADCGEKHESIEDGLAAHALMAESPPQTGLPAEMMQAAENPDMPGFDMEGRRIAGCNSCHGDKSFRICEHPVGTHGQMGVEGCPEPTIVLCPECQTPNWYTDPELRNCPSMRCPEGLLMPLEADDDDSTRWVICSDCGTRYPWDQVK